MPPGSVLDRRPRSHYTERSAGRCGVSNPVEARCRTATGEQAMRIDARFCARAACCRAAILATAGVGQISAVHGQDKSKPAKKSSKGGRTKPLANTRSLDVKADQIQSSFAKEAEDLAGQYFDAGHFEKAKTLLE